MKKLISILLVILVSSTVLVSCVVNARDNTGGEDTAKITQQSSEEATTDATSDTSLDGLTFRSDSSAIDKELAEEIKASALEFFDGRSPQPQYSDESSPKYGEMYGYVIQTYYGEIEGCHLCTIVVNGVVETILWGVRLVDIGDYTVHFPSSQLIHVYKDGNLYTVKEAYEHGVLSSKAIYEIAKNFNPDIEKAQ